MSNRKIQISEGLYLELERIAEARGYSSVDEMILHILEKLAAESGTSDADKAVIANRLKGLGYLE